LAGVIPSALVRKDCVGNFEGIMSCATEAGRVPGTVKLLRCGFADRAKDHGLRQFMATLNAVILAH
jgi:hypothetical protein